MIWYSFYLGVTGSWGGVTVFTSYIGGSLDPGGSHCILGLIDLGGQLSQGHSDRGSINPRTERPGGHSIGGH